jgi:hypothetical protein
VQYQIAVGPATSAITLTGAATGTVCTLKIDRMTSGTYAQSVGLADVVLQFSRTPAP